MSKKILIYGYGNPGRSDDGLGNVFVNEFEKYVEKEGFEDVDFDSNYQLNIEDADNISPYEHVFFIDASEENIDDFILTRVNPDDAKIEFTMHAVSTSYILNLCQQMYGKSPKTYLIHIKGYDWDFKEGLSEKAEKNMKRAMDFLKQRLNSLENIEDYITPEVK